MKNSNPNFKLVQSENESEEVTKTVLFSGEKNDRNLNKILFLDRYHQECSIQDSSLATEAAIWLGIDNSGPMLDGPTGKRNESFSGRMHLTQEMVKQLLPVLTEFANTGNLKLK